MVGLHRAAWLAEQNRAAERARLSQLSIGSEKTRPILFTTYIRTLPLVLETLYRRIPGTRDGEVKFLNIDSLARKLCREAGDRLHWVKEEDREDAFSAAYEQVVIHGTPLKAGRFTRQYLQDEISKVIKGRALGSLDAYLEVSRTGRQAPMGPRQRAQVWELMEVWNDEMDRRGVVDFPDRILRALHYARRLPQPRYSSIIVDEAQDLTLAGLLLLRALVNAPTPDVDRPDGLLILGDGAQRIFAGGYTLRQAGVEVRGRTTILKTNYRNTGQIMEAAMAVAGDISIQDLDEVLIRSDVHPSSSAGGRALCLWRRPDWIRNSTISSGGSTNTLGRTKLSVRGT